MSPFLSTKLQLVPKQGGNDVLEQGVRLGEYIACYFTNLRRDFLLERTILLLFLRTLDWNRVGGDVKLSFKVPPIRSCAILCHHRYSYPPLKPGRNLAQLGFQHCVPFLFPHSSAQPKLNHLRSSKWTKLGCFIPTLLTKYLEI